MPHMQAIYQSLAPFLLSVIETFTLLISDSPFGNVKPDEPSFVFTPPSGKKGDYRNCISNIENMKTLCEMERKLHDIYQKKSSGRLKPKKGMSVIVKIQGLAKEWSLGCMIPASWSPLAATGHSITLTSRVG